jgi:transcriptional regulator GlxA family with amidase domain
MGAGIVAAPRDGRNRPDLVIAARAGEPHNGRVSRRIVFVTYPGIIALDLVGPHEVFTAAGEVARRTGRDADAYRVEVVAPEAGVVSTSRGPSFVADRSLSSVRGEIDTLVMVGGEGARDAADDAEFVASVRRVARRARRVTSVCTGAYVLAAAGLLDGRRATTHWAWCDEFAARYPDVTVDADPIFVRDGNVWTSAGVTAGMDLALALVDEDLGRDVALITARQLGAQVAARQPLRELQHWIVEHPDADLSVDRLAARVAMSPRHFARVFRDEVGATPAVYVEGVRVEVARRLLETTDYAVDEVARTAGFGTAETIRRAFARRVGTSPSEYRDRFRPSRAS